jgi:hypothetical protein
MHTKSNIQRVLLLYEIMSQAGNFYFMICTARGLGIVSVFGNTLYAEKRAFVTDNTYLPTYVQMQ